MTEQLTLTDPLADAIAWRHKHPEAFALYLQTARNDVAAGIHPSADYCGHVVRRSGLLSRENGSPVVFNDRLTSGLARLLKREYGIPFATRRAEADRWGT